MSNIPAVQQPRPGTKRALFLQRLEGDGASITDLMQATGWQSHTVRAAMTGLRKRGFKVERQDPVDGAKSVYRVKTAAARKRRSI